MAEEYETSLPFDHAYLIGLIVGQVYVRDAVAVWVLLAPDQDARLTADLGCQLRVTVGREPKGFQMFVSDGGGGQVGKYCGRKSGVEGACDHRFIKWREKKSVIIHEGIFSPLLA